MRYVIEPSPVAFAFFWEEYVALAAALERDGNVLVTLVSPLHDRAAADLPKVMSPDNAEVVVRVNAQCTHKNAERLATKITETLQSKRRGGGFGVIVLSDGERLSFPIAGAEDAGDVLDRAGDPATWTYLEALSA